MYRRFLDSRFATLIAAGLAIALGCGPAAIGALTTVSDTFTDNASGNRDNADPLNGLLSEVGAAAWEANNVAFKQPGGTVTNTADAGVRAAVPVPGASLPIGTTYSVKVDFKFQQQIGTDTPARFVQVGFVGAGVTNNAFGAAGSRSLYLLLWADGTWDLKYDGDQFLADETHPNAQPFSLTLDDFNTVELIFRENTNAVQVFINGTSVLIPRLTPGQFLPAIDKAGFNCAALNTAMGPLPAGTVEWDSFAFTADDSTALTVLTGPLQWGGHTYYLLSPSGWASAQAKAEMLGGNLVTVNSRAEQDWIYATFGGYDIGSLGLRTCGSGGGESCDLCIINGGTKLDALWIGYHQPEPVDPNDEPADGWVWASEETAGFTFWRAGDPTNNTSCPVIPSPANAAVLVGSALAGSPFNPDNTGPWVAFNEYATVATLGVVEVNTQINNGFNPDYLYTATYHPNNNPPADAGDLVAYDATTGVLMDTLQAGADWATVTFSGTGTDDARLFAAKRHPGGSGSTDVRIDEIDAGGGTVKSVLFRSLSGAPASIGTNVEVGSLRYSAYHNSLFLAVTPNTAGLGTAVAYEMDLNLTQVLNTYTGPSTYNSAPHVAINPNDGTLYMLGARLGLSDVGTLGNLIAFDTSGGSTSTFVTLINGSTYGPGDAFYVNPNGPTFRGTNHPDDNRPTIVFNNNGTASAQNNRALEFYLDETDANGNLVKRRDAWIGRRNPYLTQLDEFTGTVMGCRIIGQQSGLFDSGIDQLLTDDVHFRPVRQAGVNDRFFQRGQNDTASPGFRVSAVEPFDKVVATGYLGAQAAPGSFTFALRNKGYRNPGNASLPADSNVNRDVSYTVVKVPDDETTQWLTLDRTDGGPLLPGQRDLPVTVTLDTDELAPGVHSVELQFIDDASPPNVHSRIVEVHVLECSWEVSPTPNGIAYVLAAPTPQTYELTVKNLQGAALDYTVEEVAADGITPQDHAWLTVLDTAGADLAAGQTATVRFTVDSPSTANTGYLRFVPSCGTATSGAQPEVRTIQVVNTLLGGQPLVSLYQGNVDPTAFGSCGTDCNFELTTDAGNMLMGSVVNDPAACDGKAWRIEDDNAANTWTHLRVSNNAPGLGAAASGGTHNGNLGSTLVARIKVPSNTAAGTMLGINLNAAPNTAARVEWGGAGPNLPGLVRETFRGVNGVDNGSTSDRYAIIRVASGFGLEGSRSIKVWVNEDKDPVPDPLQVLALSGLTNGPGQRGFGYGFGMEGTAQVTGEVWFDWVVFTTAGMFAPGEELTRIGRSLIPACCPNPFADADEDGDVDMVDFAALQRCYTGNVTGVSEECRCFDHDGNDRIDRFDVTDFAVCGSGADVPADPACDDGP